MKKYMSIFTLVMIVFVLLSCAEEKQAQKNTENQIQEDTEKGVIITDTNAGYEIEVLDDEYYVVFEDEKYKNNVNASQVEPSLKFSSVAEMKDKLLNGKLTEDEIEMLSTFSKDSAGKIKMPSLEKLFAPTAPENVECLGSVNWGGGSDRYSVELTSNDCYVALFEVESEKWYEKKYKDNYNQLHNNELVTITKTEKSSERNATVYWYTTSAGEFKAIEYSISTKEGTIFVFETYCLSINHNLMTVSATVPHGIKLHGDFGDRYYYCSIYELTERPSVEWLSSFGLIEVK